MNKDCDISLALLLADGRRRRDVYKIAQTGGADGHHRARCMRHKKTLHRSRDMFARYKAGQTVASLAQQYGLSAVRVRALLTEEKQRHQVSPEYFYEALRNAWLTC